MTTHKHSSVLPPLGAPRKRQRLWPALTGATALLAVASAVFALLGGHGAQASAPAAAPPAVPVSVAAVQATDITAWDEFSGRLEAVHRVELRSRVAGAVQSVHFQEGALVKAGDLLVTIDPAPYAAEVERAQAQVNAAQSRLAHSASEHQRAARLWQEQAIAQRELDERENGWREAQANLRAAQAALQSARLSLGYTQVRAPVAGRIGKLEVTVGNLVAAGPGAPVLSTLVSVSPIYASFDADEQVVARALRQLHGSGSGNAAQRAQLEQIPVQMGLASDAATPHQGHLQLIDNQVDARTGTVRVRATFDNADGTLIPGQFARIRMGQAQPVKTVLVNERAIGTDQNKKYVLVVNDKSQVEYREVTLGGPANGLRIVASGLQPGERVVVNGLQHVRPGAAVAPKDVPMETAQAANAAARIVASNN